MVEVMLMSLRDVGSIMVEVMFLSSPKVEKVIGEVTFMSLLNVVLVLGFAVIKTVDDFPVDDIVTEVTFFLTSSAVCVVDFCAEELFDSARLLFKGVNVIVDVAELSFAASANEIN